MKNEKILTVIKGQEFKLSLKDKIEINDIFYDQYLEAAAMLENIMANEESDKQPDWKKAETENNIIAFCGERGEGKSSAMFTFINAVVNENLLYLRSVRMSKILFFQNLLLLIHPLLIMYIMC